MDTIYYVVESIDGDIISNLNTIMDVMEKTKQFIGTEGK